MPAQTAGRQQYLALSQAIRQHGVRQPCDVIGHIAATISFGAYGNDVPAISQPSLVMAKTRTSRWSRPGAWPPASTAQARLPPAARAPAAQLVPLRPLALVTIPARHI
jgi:hypothetical protein